MAITKQNPLAAQISMIGGDGAPDVFIGHCNFKIVDEARGWIAGVLLDATGQDVGKVEIEGFPLGEILSIKGPGRPPANEKHLAVLLAWALKVGELGGKQKAGKADQLTAERFAYLNDEGEGNAKTVRDIRRKQAARLGLDLDKDAAHIIDDSADGEGPPVCSILIEMPTFYETPGGGLEILCAKAIVWGAEMGAHVKCLPAMRIVMDIAEPGDGLAAWRVRGGPKIISIIRPGR